MAFGSFKLSRNSTEMLDDQSPGCSIEISASRATIIKNSVKIFEQQLKNNWTRQKVPKGTKKDFQQTLGAGKTTFLPRKGELISKDDMIELSRSLHSGNSRWQIKQMSREKWPTTAFQRYRGH
ncbi:hypothetical protein N7539_007050 [Penicillium diatomitis]|uniref:Uncharacterized protein n=1 Tax=Penicillium diatomitis TaxID=2819901 RepID=A0A9W9X3K5_9EURO|nr:uncharacterized protein N7539_007050 [Penicillium diatomitis]KAJ5481156.1 hypothetical protein N7539_007050 [Penicillium diatomitis]